MSKAKVLKVCNIVLLIITLPIIFSAIQMEVCAGRQFANLDFAGYMVIHAILGGIMILTVFTHLYLHFGRFKWLQKIKKLKNKSTKALCLFFGLMFVSGIVSLIHTVASMNHSAIGAVHGKIGFVFLAIFIVHIVKRWWWIRKTRSENKGG